MKLHRDAAGGIGQQRQADLLLAPRGRRTPDMLHDSRRRRARVPNVCEMLPPHFNMSLLPCLYHLQRIAALVLLPCLFSDLVARASHYQPGFISR